MKSSQIPEGSSSQKHHWQPFVLQTKQTNSTPKRSLITTLQINLGKLCNQSCLHCHVDAGPTKTKENMDESIARRVIELTKNSKNLDTVDLTGGAPELNPHFRHLVKTFRSLGLKVIDRCNLTVLFTKGQEGLAEFLAKNEVNVIASLPCYSSENVEKQRGKGVFAESIAGLQLLNSFGYGKNKGLVLDLVYNPIGPQLPPSQPELEKDYKERLFADFGIEFDNLYTITNMPIKRFLFDLKRSGKYHEYLNLLAQNFNNQAAKNVMCRTLVSLSWDGSIFDCDFNQMLLLPVKGKRSSIFQIESFDELADQEIQLGDHCYGCTAGAGSSCTGAVAPIN